MKSKLLLFVCLIVTIGTQAQTVNNLSGSYHDGQIFITWTDIPLCDTGFYYIYKNTVPITSGNIQTSTYLGRVPHDFGYDFRYTYSLNDQVHKHYLVTNDTNYLSPDQNLFVVNCTKKSEKDYFAVRCNFGKASPNWIVVAGANATTVSVTQLKDPIKCYLEDANIPFDGAKNHEKMDVYVHYGGFTSVGNYPDMANEACFAFHFGIIKTGSVGGNNAVFLKFHGGRGNFITNATTTVIENAWKISFDDWVPMYGIDTVGDNTKWLGYNEKLNVYTVTRSTPSPKTGKVKAYTYRRVKWELGWIKSNWPGTLDSTREYLLGSSQGCAAVMLNSIIDPGLYAAGNASDGKFDMDAPFDYNPDCNYNDGESGRAEANAVWGDHDSTNLLTDIKKSTGGGYYKIYDLTNLNDMFKTDRNLSFPFLEAITGKNDENTCWQEKPDVYSAINEYNVGGKWYWDLRGHGGDSLNEWGPLPIPALVRYRINLTYPAISSTSLDGNTGDDSMKTPPYFNGDDVGSLHGNFDWLDNTIVDSAKTWQMDLYAFRVLLDDGTYKPTVLPAYATTSITIRRPQQFKNFAVGTKICWSVTDNGQTIQSGSVKQKFSGTLPLPITIKGVKIYSDTSTLRLIVCSSPEPPSNNAPERQLIVENIMQVYPDPFYNNLSVTVSVNEISDVLIEIYNVVGQQMKALNISNVLSGKNYFNLNTLDFKPGVYFVNVKAGELQQTFKVVKE